MGLGVKFLPPEEELGKIDGVLATGSCKRVNEVALGHFPPTVGLDVDFFPPEVELDKTEGVLATELCGVSASGLFSKDVKVSCSC